jgi:hypothetical protein
MRVYVDVQDEDNLCQWPSVACRQVVLVTKMRKCAFMPLHLCLNLMTVVSSSSIEY